MKTQPNNDRSGLPGRGRDGIAAVEFGLMAPLLLILLTGVGEIGIAAYQSLQVQAAVEAGALYAVKHPPSSPSDTTGLNAIGTAVTSGTATAGITASPAPTAFCGCPATTGIVSQGSNCTTVCSSDSKAPGQYVLVNAKITHTTLLPYLSLPLPATLTASSTVRVR
jgi:Flp pilus assembly protein TadG